MPLEFSADSGGLPAGASCRTPRRIAFAMINCNRRDGSARAVNEVAERLADRGHDVCVYARKAEDLDLAKVSWRKVPGPGWPEVVDFGSYYALANRMLNASRCDIIHSIGVNTSKANVFTIQNIQPAKKILLDRLTSDEKVSPPRRFTRWLYLRFTCLIERRLYTYRTGRKPVLFLPVSRGVEAELRRHYDIGASPVRIIPNAADVDKFVSLSDEERRTWRLANGIDADDTLAIFAGGEWARKGLDFAIRALGLVRRPALKLYVAGDDPDRGRFVQMARDSGCGDRVIFGGFRRDIATAMGAADLFLFPSLYEAFSLATIEAAACGLPVVASKINGTDDFIIPGKNGDFIQHDAAHIASVLTRLSAEPELMREMGRQGRAMVKAHYTWDRVAALTEQAYQEHLDHMRSL